MERVTKMQMWKTKGAEASGTDLMPLQGPSVKKKGKNELPVKTAMSPHVNVTNLQPPTKAQMKVAQRFALPSMRRYPLDNYEQVKTASAYFDEWSNVMTPASKREYCCNLVKRAAELGIEVSKTAARYGAEGYSEDVEAMLLGRKALLPVEHHGLLDKLAEVRPLLPADVFCAALQELDEQTGLDHKWGKHVPDPYYSTYGTKMAERDELIMVGTEAVPKRAIINGAITYRESIEDTFGDALAQEFSKDPMGIFNSLPRDQKKMIMRMVTRNAPGPDTQGSI
jgi:hypothetical protein